MVVVLVVVPNGRSQTTLWDESQAFGCQTPPCLYEVPYAHSQSQLSSGCDKGQLAHLVNGGTSPLWRNQTVSLSRSIGSICIWPVISKKADNTPTTGKAFWKSWFSSSLSGKGTSASQSLQSLRAAVPRARPHFFQQTCLLPRVIRVQSSSQAEK